jgi:hypothetical protein
MWTQMSKLNFYIYQGSNLAGIYIGYFLTA